MVNIQNTVMAGMGRLMLVPSGIHVEIINNQTYRISSIHHDIMDL